MTAPAQLARNGITTVRNNLGGAAPKLPPEFFFMFWIEEIAAQYAPDKEPTHGPATDADGAR